MKLEVIGINQKEQWDSIVKSFKEYDVYYLNGYVKSFQNHGDGEPLLLYFESNKTRAVNVVMKRDISDCIYFRDRIEKNKYFDFSTVYGYGGFIVEGDDIALINETYVDYCKSNNIISEFVRFHPLLNNHTKMQEMYDLVHLGKTVFIDTSSEDVIWKNISSKNRNMIRKAEKAGLKTYWGRYPEIIDDFMEIYQETMDRDDADEYYYFDRAFYHTILEDLKDSAMWFYTKVDNVIASIAIFMYENGKMHYHLSASRYEYRTLAPSNLMLYEAAMWANKNGYNKLHLGGGIGSGEDNLYKFKKSFNREEDSEFWIGKKVFIPELYDEMISIRKKFTTFDCESSFFPKYRI